MTTQMTRSKIFDIRTTKDKLKDIIKLMITWIIRIGSIFAVIYLFRYLGLKGLIGLMIGFGIMAVLVLSQNPIFLMFIKLLDLIFPNTKEKTNMYVDEIKNDTRETDKEKFNF